MSVASLPTRAECLSDVAARGDVSDWAHEELGRRVGEYDVRTVPVSLTELRERLPHGCDANAIASGLGDVARKLAQRSDVRCLVEEQPERRIPRAVRRGAFRRGVQHA